MSYGRDYPLPEIVRVSVMKGSDRPAFRPFLYSELMLRGRRIREERGMWYVVCRTENVGVHSSRTLRLRASLLLYILCSTSYVPPPASDGSSLRVTSVPDSS